MNRKEALNTIGYVLGEVEEELDSNNKFDDQIIIEIGQACKNWEDRQDDLEVPWSVRLFDGNKKIWIMVKSGIKKEEAYRVWYQQTSGGTLCNDSRSDSYYFMCPENIKLYDRHEYDDDDDDFSYRYLLNKSFGE